MKAIDLIENDYEISPHARYLKKHKMYSAAIFYKNLNDNLMYRSGSALRYLLEIAPLPEYTKGQVIFANEDISLKHDILEGAICQVNFDGDCCIWDLEKFKALPEENPYEGTIKKIIMDNSKFMYGIVMNPRYLHYGGHNVIDFKYLLDNGLAGYKERLTQAIAETDDVDKAQFCMGLMHLTEGIITYVERYVEKLKQIENPDEKLTRLINALEVVPLNPATNFYEAYLTICMGMFFSGNFEPGRLDKLLFPYYEKDDSVSREDAIYLLREFLEGIERRMEHPGTTHITIGGSNVDGTPDYNELTELIIIAVGGLRAPNVSLRVREDMPQKLWDVYLDNTSKGYTQPAIVNETPYINGLVNDYDVPMEDAVNYVFGGCTETMIQGKTCCDAIWNAYNMLDVFENTMYGNLLDCNDFESFYELVKRDVLREIQKMYESDCCRQHTIGINATVPFRSLFIDGCIQSGKSFYNGGAIYNFDSTNIYGIANTVNSLYTIKKFFEGEFGELSKEDFLKCFANNYKGYEELHAKCNSVPKFGNYNEEISAMTKDLTTPLIEKLKTFVGPRGNNKRYLPAIILWIDFVKCGSMVGATPDGRVAAQDIADSCGPMQGTDVEGPTSSLGSALDIPAPDFVGTAVFNLRLDKKHFDTAESRTKVQQLLSSYFMQGGTQVQINVVDRKTLEDALIHPENHKDLIVRVGGFSDNFIYLTDEIKQGILQRTEH